MMKTTLLFLAIILATACSSRKTTVNNAEESAVLDSGTSGMPKCLKDMIETYKVEEKQNPPRKIYSYLYKGKTVFYVTPPCCDFFSDLYDSSCKLIGHPDGGITGRGDGKFTDFETLKTNEKLVWEDTRK